MPLHFGQAGGDAVFGGREEHGQEALEHQVVQLGLGFAQVMRDLQRGDDGKVIRHLLVVEDAAVRLDPLLADDGVRVARQAAHGVGAALGQRAHGFLHRGDVVLGQVARIGTRVGQRLVAFVQGLGQRQRGLGRKAEPAVGLALQRRQVVQGRRHLGRRLGFFSDVARLVAAGGHHALRGGGRPQARFALFRVTVVFLELRVDPAAFVQAGGGDEGGAHFPVVAGHEAADALFTLGHDGQRGRLHAADRRLEEAAVLAVEGGHGAGAVDADQPVGLGARTGGGFQRLQLDVVAQVGEGFADGGLRHGLQPQALNRLFHARILNDVAEDQFAFASRVTGVDDRIHVLALGQADQQLQAFCRLLVGGAQFEFRRNHGQVREAPLSLDRIIGRDQAQQVADAGREYVTFAFKIVALARKASQGA
ncbi:hypothetical protein D3C85_698610 [compost metagenome]